MLNLNTPNKQWNMYLNTLSSISGDDLTIKPDTRRNLLLEVSGNNNIFIKRGDVSYNLSNLIRGDVSFSNVDVSNNLNPSILTGRGGTITISGGYIIHSFTTTGTSGFIPAFSGNVEALVVGGGGGGGGGNGVNGGGGGGGGGGVVYITYTDVSAGINYPVVVGSGGGPGSKGNNSSVFGSNAEGGGSNPSNTNGTSGGSGGGAAASQNNMYSGGVSNGNILGINNGIVNVGFTYGNRGGNITTTTISTSIRAAGGGGAGGQAVDTSTNIIGDTGQTGAGSGGVGIVNSILGTSYYWGGGGGGGARIDQSGGWGGWGGGGGGRGSAGGGRGGVNALNNGTNATTIIAGAGGANTGGGGGGASGIGGGGLGGSGIVVIRYLERTSNLGLPNKLWGNAFIRDISATNISISGNMTISGTISNVIQIIPRLANDISSSLGNNTNIWQKAFINDLSGISRINGSTWPLSVSTGPTGPTGAIGVSGVSGPTGVSGALGVSINATLTDISNFRITTKNRIYQDISGGINDLSWTSVNGYYGLAKDAYPSLNPLSSGVKAVSTWTSRALPSATTWRSVCWSPEQRMFVAVGANVVVYSFDGLIWSNQTTGVVSSGWFSVCWSPQLTRFVAVASSGTNKVMYSSNGINWTSVLLSNSVSWADVCWSPQLGLFVAVGTTTTNRVMYSYDGSSNWTQPAVAVPLGGGAIAICWSPELKLFVVVSDGGLGVFISSNGINWTTTLNYPNSLYIGVCWSPLLGLFVAVSYGGQVMISSNGINWSVVSVPYANWGNVSWCIDIGLFIAVAGDGTNRLMYSPNGKNWTSVFIQQLSWESVCWSPELGLAVIVGRNGGAGINSALCSSLKGRPPTSYNVFDSSFNRIDENGKWDFSNINVKTLTAGGASVSSDDRLKHNEVVINNGLDIIDQLSPKFYKKTQVLLDASYNGDLTGYAWTLEAGLIAQELLQISDLSFTVGGGDYYEQTYKLITQTNDLSNSYYDLSTNYEVSNNLIAQAYNVNYNSIFVYGVAAIKELHTKVKTQETSILDEQLNDLVLRIEALESNNNV